MNNIILMEKENTFNDIGECIKTGHRMHQEGPSG
jgi:hypothetical protein